MIPAGFTPLDVLTDAHFEVLPGVAILLSAAWYLWGVRRLAARGRRWPALRTASFLFAELLIATGLLSGIAQYDDSSFLFHTIQHLLIGMVAPVFIALAAPVTLLLQSSHRRIQTGVLKVIHSAVGRLLSNPLVTWPLYGASLFGLYFTGLYADTLTNDTLHQIVHAHLILTGCLFYWPVVGIDPLPRRLGYGVKILYLMLSLPFHTILGMALESQTNQIAPGISLTDLHYGGSLMWVAGEAIGLIGTLLVFVQWLRADERAARRYDRMTEAAAAEQLALWRAAREAAARAS